MVEWIRSFFSKSDFKTEGTLIKLADFSDNYSKATIIMDASLTIKNSLIFVKNEEYDPEQEQAEFLQFPIDHDMQMTHYTILDDETQIEGIKWVNLSASISESAMFIGFEFSEASDYQAFLTQISSLVQVDEEGLQHPASRDGNLKQIQSKLNVTTNVAIVSKINKQQIEPEIESSQEEVKIEQSLDFKKSVISHLHDLYTPDQIIYTSPGDLYFHDPNKKDSVLMERGIGILVIKHAPFQYSLDLVKEGQVIMRNLLNKNFSYSIDLGGQNVSFLEVIGSTIRYWTAILLDDMTHLEELFLVAQFESSRQISVEADLSAEDKA